MSTPPTPPGRPPGPPPPMPPPGRPPTPPPTLPPALHEPAPPSPAPAPPAPAPPDAEPPEPSLQEPTRSESGAPEPSPPAPAPPGEPQDGRRRSRRGWLIGAGVVAIVVVIALVAGGDGGGGDGDSTSDTVDQGRECDVFAGVLAPSDVQSALGISITTMGSDITECDFGEASDFDESGTAPISFAITREDAEGFEQSRDFYSGEEDGTTENIDGLGDAAFYFDSSFKNLFARRGDLVLKISYIGPDDSDIREKLVGLAGLVIDRLPADVTLPDE